MESNNNPMDRKNARNYNMDSHNIIRNVYLRNLKIQFHYPKDHNCMETGK